MFDALDVGSQRFILTVLNSLFILGISIELYRSSSAVGNKRLISIYWKAALFAFSFFICRILAGLLDAWFMFPLSWFSNLVNAVYWAAIFWKVHSVRVILSDVNTAEERVELRTSIDQVLGLLDSAKRKLRKIRL